MKSPYERDERDGRDEQDGTISGLRDFTISRFHDFTIPRFHDCRKGLTFPRHTTGNALVVVESEGLFYIIHGDVTYTDAALYENKLSVVFEDKAAARETLDRVREFVSKRPTVYLGTHTPEALESLAAKRVVDLANPPEIIPPGEIVFKTATGKYICSVCGYLYDPEKGDPANGIAPGTPFEALPDDWHCPRCRQPKTAFQSA